ncbi:energy transducer TonB [Erythrobacter sp.]|jgi:TonB family protein|uniref:energy transducer TonB n=1 Tax=Erythrobacter sp. TaxID=1042 RepID=UPI002E9C36AA|nr:energy transducer TonB [Erythrobacter sp.]
MRDTYALLVLTASLASAPAGAEVVDIAPSSAWNVDFADDKCRLARLFGEGENRHLVFFEQYWPSEGFGLTVAGPSFDRFRSRRRTELSFFDGQDPQRTEPFTGKVAGFGPGVIYSSAALAPADEVSDEQGDDRTTRLSQLDPGLASKVAYVGIKQRGDEIRLLTGPLDEAFEVLNQCTAGLVAEWGLDFERQRSASRMPEWTNMAAVVRRIQKDYPRTALNRGEQGLMRMRVIVSPEGLVEECTIIKATDTEKLESPACDAMQDAKFTPALDAAGQPMRSYYVTRITYQI